MITMTSREFNQASSKVLKLSQQEPVVVTNRGKPSNVVLDFATYEALQRLKQPEPNLADVLTPDDIIEVDDEMFEQITQRPAIFSLRPAVFD